MRKHSLYIIIVFLTFFFCNRLKKQDQNKSVSPKIIEAFGSVVNMDSLAKPNVVRAGKPKVVSVGRPKIVTINTNVHIAGKPVIVLAGIPKIITPGKDTFLLPEKVPVIEHPFLAEIPEIVMAKDAYIKDQNPQNFSSYSKLQGLKHNAVKCIFQDNYGNIWFGTNGGGASKFDGKFFTHFSKKEGLGNNYVKSIIQDLKGNIWFATQGAGVTKYDGKFFTHFTEKEGLSNNKVQSLLLDNNGDIWMGTEGGGISKYDGKYFTHFTEKEGLSNNNVLCGLQDKSGNLWFGTYGGGVSRYDGKAFTNFTEKEGLSNNKVLSIFLDKDGYLWFGTDGGGLSKYNGNLIEAIERGEKVTISGQEEQKKMNGKLVKTFSNFTEKEGLSNNSINSILQDNSGMFWFGTNGGGILKYNGNSFTHFTENEGLGNNSVYCIYEDTSGNLWFGTNGAGVSKYNGKTFTYLTKEEGLNSNSVSSILQDNNGILWFGTNGGGVASYNEKTLTKYTEKEGLNSNYISSILQDKSGNIWFGSFIGGVSKYDGSTFTHYTEREGLSSNKVQCLMQDKEGCIWIGTDGGGVTKFDGKSFTHFTVKEGLSNDILQCILEDNRGNIWFGTEGGGISKYDGTLVEAIERGEKIPISDQYDLKRKKGKLVKSFTHFTEKEGLSSNFITSILQDKQGIFWFGSEGGGIIRYDGKCFTNFTEKEGLSNNTILSILEGKTGDLWIGTRFGLSRLTRQNLASHLHKPAENGVDIYGKSNNHQYYQFKNYNYEDGFLGIGCFRGAIFEDKSSNLWIGTNGKLTSYHSAGDEPDTIAPNIQLTGIELFNENIPWVNLEQRKDTSLILGNGVSVGNFKFEGTTKWYGIPNDLSLAYNNNFLTFNFIGITQKQSNRVKYQYILEGIDENWCALTSQNQAAYGNLPFGSYTFKVKAMNSEGYWSKEYIYTFSIRPPWWKTWWFGFLTAILILLSLFWFYRWRIAALNNQKKQLEQTVNERTREVLHQKEELEAINEELKQSNDELHSQREELGLTFNSLQAAQEKLIQSEKMASLGILAAGVAHEINNPLNFIQSGIDGIETYFIENYKNHDEEISTLINAIKVGVGRAASIVTSLNHYSRQDDTKKINCNIHEIIDNCLVVLHNQYKNRIEIQKQFTEKIFAFEGNEGKLHQAFLNILGNAVHAIAEIGKISILTNIVKEEIHIEISDTGHGITAENLKKIFDPFFTTKDPGKGTGLGLAITYNIIQEHGGTIEIESSPGKGTKVMVKFPINAKLV